MTAPDVPAVTSVLARAFENNPATSWTLRNPDTRRHKLESGWAAYMRRFWLPRGECWTTDALDGAAIWLPPGGWEVPIGLQLRLFPTVLATARLETVRLMRYINLVERKHPHKPHWYLAVLGVHPARQGRGFGSHLMRPVLERCDSEGVPAYLETDTEKNVQLYARHGFAVTEELNLPDGGPPIWLMWREPL